MFKGYRDGRFAIGLILGIGIGIFWILILDVSSPLIDPSTSSMTDCGGTANDCGNNSNGVPDRGYWLRRFFALEDTLAQWIMMAFTIAAAFLLLGTLRATQEMARETSQIGNDQINAANDAVRVAAQQFRAGFKPWISVDMKGAFLGRLRHDDPPMVEPGPSETSRLTTIHGETFVTNIGTIPVTIEDFDLRAADWSRWAYVHNTPAHLKAKKVDFFAIIPSGTTIQINPMSGVTEHHMPIATFTLPAMNRVDFKMDPPPLIGKIVYSDPMGVRYEHNFAFVARPSWGKGFSRYGGRKYNYEREIK